MLTVYSSPLSGNDPPDNHPHPATLSVLMRLLLGSTICALILLAVPLQRAHAASVHFDFGLHRTNATWNGTGLITGTMNEEGVILQTTNGTGALLTSTTIPFVADTATVVLSADQPGVLHLVQFEETIGDTIMLRSIYHPYSAGSQQRITIPITDSEWNSGSMQIGFLLGPQSRVLLHQFSLSHTPMFTRIWEGWRSFWTLDAYRPYSINFLWGPLLAWTEGTRTTIWDSMPPRALSATFALFTTLLIMAVIMLSFGYWRRRMSAAVTVIVMIVGGAWLVMDLRMGIEYLSWVVDDHRWAVQDNRSTADFRDRDGFYDFAAMAATLVADRERYIFLAPREWPFFGNIRYITYPSLPGNAIETDDTWVIFDRPDVSVGDDGRLQSNGQPISAPGTVLGILRPGSFVFRVSPPPSAP